MVSRWAIMHLDHPDLFLYNALFHHYVFRLFLGGARPDSRSCSPSKRATNNRTTGPTNFRTDACTYAAAKGPTYNRALIHIARRSGTYQANAEQQNCQSFELHLHRFPIAKRHE